MILLLTISAQAQRGAAETHLVRPGETLGLIARLYGLDIPTLASANGISNAHRIGAWQELIIPVDGNPRSTETTIRGTHIVRRGETLGSIAEAYGLTLYELQAANNIWTWFIYAGQELAIPGDGIPITQPETPADAPTSVDAPAPQDEQPAIESSGISHKVQFGETLGKIAEAYGVTLEDLQALNNIWTWLIYVGQELDIPAGGKVAEGSASEQVSSTTDINRAINARTRSRGGADARYPYGAARRDPVQNRQALRR